MAFTFGGLGIVIAIILSQVKNLGTVKSQEIQLMSQAGYSFNISQQMHFVGAVYFWMEELMPVIQ